MTSPLQIGNLTINHPLILAPMVGITDLPFRLICRKFGAPLTFVEMLNCRSLSHKSKKTFEMLRGDPQDKPLGCQLLGAEIKYILPALEIMHKFPVDLIDFNAACPVKKVVKRGEGAALLKSPKKLYRILKAMVRECKLPLTVKIRTGWSRDSVNAVEVAKYCQDAGVKALFIHGRTTEQKYAGEVDYQTIAKVKKVLSIPVVASGNIWSVEFAKKMFENTGCDGVCVARGALGNPWIFRELEFYLKHKEVPLRPSLAQIIKVFFEHLDREVEFYGEKKAILLFRKFIGWYFKGVQNIRQVREKSSHIKTKADLVYLLKEAKIIT